jgi:hypothetical protein
MDDIVQQAMRKWPNVPDCYGWLGLDERGQWFMRDEAAQAQGHFQSGRPGAKGALLTHTKLIEFIERNYEADADGRWYFQNGPQRVYVELQATPWIWRLEADLRITAHTGRPAQLRECLMDETGRVYLHTDLGFGLVHTMDVNTVAQALERGTWRMVEIQGAEMPQKYHYIQSPEGAQAKDQLQHPSQA